MAQRKQTTKDSTPVGLAWPLPEDLSAGRRFTTRQLELLEELEGIVLAEGFDHLTVAELAERLRCSRRTLYELAESKDELVLLVIDRALRKVARRAHEAVREADDPLATLRAFFFAGIVELRRATVAFSEDVARFAPARRLMNSHFHFATMVVEQLVEQGVQSGHFRGVHPRIVAELLDAGVERIQDPNVLRVAGITIAEALEEVLSLAVEGIAGTSKTDARRQRRKRR